MNLKILLPTEILMDETVHKVTGEAENGSFTLLPSHIDFVTALTRGLLSFEKEGVEIFVAVDEGILVKTGQEVLVSTTRAVCGKKLGELRKVVEEQFKVLGEKEKNARAAMAKIEAGFIRRFLEVQQRA
ncbi:MAG: F0F1 ATP synthase subunit epsilon [Deltaproteobacteria bacterium]|nr:F0F1 ATP synthase subunit epsilon [Deltaproteobacteria bacterium]